MIQIASILLGLLILGLQFVGVASWFGLGWVFLLIILWGVQVIKPGIFHSLTLILTLAAAAFAVFLNVPFLFLSYLASWLGLAAWDTGAFLSRIHGSSPGPEEKRRLERAHLKQIAGIAFLGLGIGGLTLHHSI